MFEGLTKYIPVIGGTENEARTISKLEDEVYNFARKNPECGLKYFRDILKSQGVNLEKTRLDHVEVKGLSWLAVMALFLAAVQEERHSIGTLDRLYRNGSIKSWLCRLKEIDDKAAASRS